MRRGNSHFSPSYRIDNSRLPGIWGSDNSDFEAVSNPLRHKRARGLPLPLGKEACERPLNLFLKTRWHLIFRKINAGLNEGRDSDKLRPPPLDLMAKVAREGPLSLDQLCVGFRIYEICQTFDLRQIEPPILQRASGELSRLSQATVRQRLEDRLQSSHDCDAAMHVEFHGKFTGKTRTRIEPQNQCIIDDQIIMRQTP